LPNGGLAQIEELTAELRAARSEAKTLKHEADTYKRRLRVRLHGPRHSTIAHIS
jgi:hypothetical protein